MKDTAVMQSTAQFHQIRECPNCHSYWRHSGRKTVGFVETHEEETCPNCRAS